MEDRFRRLLIISGFFVIILFILSSPAFLSNDENDNGKLSEDDYFKSLEQQSKVIQESTQAESVRENSSYSGQNSPEVRMRNEWGEEAAAEYSPVENSGTNKPRQGVTSSGYTLEEVDVGL